MIQDNVKIYLMEDFPIEDYLLITSPYTNALYRLKIP